MLEYTTTTDLAAHYARAHDLRAETARSTLRALAGLFRMKKGPRIAAQPQTQAC